MKLSECTFGKLVHTPNNPSNGVGMIRGITNNQEGCSVNIRSKPEFATIIVKWSSGMEHPVHPDNLELFED